MSDAPLDIRVHIVEDFVHLRPCGVGEPGVPPYALALVNAIHYATGKRDPEPADRRPAQVGVVRPIGGGGREAPATCSSPSISLGMLPSPSGRRVRHLDVGGSVSSMYDPWPIRARRSWRRPLGYRQGVSMRKQTIQYTSPIDALIAVTKRLSNYESRQRMDSEAFFDRYTRGQFTRRRGVRGLGETTIVTSCSFARSWRRASLMLHEALAAYLARVEQAILRCRGAYVERYVEEVIAPERVNLRIRLRFAQGHLLEINEAAIVEDDALVLLDYRYHCQDGQNRLIFRYDSTPSLPQPARLSAPQAPARRSDRLGPTEPSGRCRGS